MLFRERFNKQNKPSFLADPPKKKNRPTYLEKVEELVSGNRVT